MSLERPETESPYSCADLSAALVRQQLAHEGHELARLDLLLNLEGHA